MWLRFWQGKRKEWVALAGIVVVGLLLRLVNLGTEPYWHDEVLSLQIVRHFSSVSALVDYLSWVEVHPPLYYLVLHYWLGWFGESEFAVHMLSVLFGLGVVVLAYALARRLFPKSPSVGLWGALLVAVLPFQIEYSQEARPYIMFCFFGLLQALALWQWRHKRKAGYLALYAGAGVIGLYLHYSFSFIVLALGVWWLGAVVWERSQGWSREFTIWLATQAAIFLGFYYWLSSFLYKTIALGDYSIWGIARTGDTGVRPLTLFAKALVQYAWLNQEGSDVPLVLLGVFIFQAVAVWFTCRFFMRWKPVSGATGGDGKAISFLGTLLLLPLVLFLFSPQSQRYTLISERHVIVGSVVIAILLAWLLVQLDVRRRLVLFFLFLASIIPSLALVLGDDSVWNPDFRLKDVGSYVSEHYRPGDLVVVSAVFFRTNINYFLRPEVEAVGFYPFGYYGNDYLGSREALGVVENEIQLRIRKTTPPELADRYGALVEHYHPRRVWLLYFQPGWEAAGQNWFTSHGWRQNITSPHELFPVDLFTLKP